MDDRYSHRADDAAEALGAALDPTLRLGLVRRLLDNIVRVRSSSALSPADEADYQALCRLEHDLLKRSHACPVRSSATAGPTATAGPRRATSPFCVAPRSRSALSHHFLGAVEA
jgi:hypothetical protein